MAEQFDRDVIEEVKKRYPGYAVVAYVNTTAELKTVADVCVTSSSAVNIITVFSGAVFAFTERA